MFCRLKKFFGRKEPLPDLVDVYTIELRNEPVDGTLWVNGVALREGIHYVRSGRTVSLKFPIAKTDLTWWH